MLLIVEVGVWRDVEVVGVGCVLFEIRYIYGQRSAGTCFLGWSALSHQFESAPRPGSAARCRSAVL